MKTYSSLKFLKLLSFWLCNDHFLSNIFFTLKPVGSKAQFIHVLDNWSLKITVHTLARRCGRFTALNIYCPVLVKILSVLTGLLNSYQSPLLWTQLLLSLKSLWHITGWTFSDSEQFLHFGTYWCEPQLLSLIWT